MSWAENWAYAFRLRTCFIYSQKTRLFDPIIVLGETLIPPSARWVSFSRLLVSLSTLFAPIHASATAGFGKICDEACFASLWWLHIVLSRVCLVHKLSVTLLPEHNVPHCSGPDGGSLFCASIGVPRQCFDFMAMLLTLCELYGL